MTVDVMLSAIITAMFVSKNRNIRFIFSILTLTYVKLSTTAKNDREPNHSKYNRDIRKRFTYTLHLGGVQRELSELKTLQ